MAIFAISIDGEIVIPDLYLTERVKIGGMYSLAHIKRWADCGQFPPSPATNVAQQYLIGEGGPSRALEIAKLLQDAKTSDKVHYNRIKYFLRFDRLAEALQARDKINFSSIQDAAHTAVQEALGVKLCLTVEDIKCKLEDIK